MCVHAHGVGRGLRAIGITIFSLNVKAPSRAVYCPASCWTRSTCDAVDVFLFYNLDGNNSKNVVELDFYWKCIYIC